MRRLVAILGMVAIVGTMSAGLGAQAKGTTRSDARTTDQSPGDRQELARLRAKLAELKEQLQRLERALREARQAGNRALAARLMEQIKKVKDEIARVERRIRQLLGGR